MLPLGYEAVGSLVFRLLWYVGLGSEYVYLCIVVYKSVEQVIGKTKGGSSQEQVVV